MEKNRLVIETKKLCKTIKQKDILLDVNLNVRKGDIYGLIGHNGSGKTTLLKLIAGTYNASSGEIKINGKSEQKELNLERKKIGSLIDFPSFQPNLTGKENLIAIAIESGVYDKEYLDKLLKAVHLDPNDKNKVKHYSLGMKQKLAISMALINKPEILLLDEPANGLDPTGIFELRELLSDISINYGVTIIISSHQLVELSKFATTYGVINHGRLVREFRSGDLEMMNKPFIKVKVEDSKKAIHVLLDNFDTPEYEVLPFNTFAIYDVKRGVTGISSLFNDYNIKVLSIAECDGDLEQTFFTIMGEYE